VSRRRTVADLADDKLQEQHYLREHRAKTQIKALREQVDAQNREIDALHRALGVVEDLRAAPKVKPIVRRERTSGLREATAIVMCSDWHVEEIVRPETVNGLNAYNPRIARERNTRLNEAFAWEVEHERHAFKIRDCMVWLGGDIITGYIHRELIEGNAMSPTEAVLFAQELCEATIDKALALDMERVVVPCNYGNHGRTTDKKQIATGYKNSYEWLMYQTLKRRYADDKRVEFVIASGPLLYTKAYDFTQRWSHGDPIKYGGGVGGITIPVVKKINQWNKARHADETFFGHFHTRLTLRGINGNGSLIGYGPYSVEIGAEPEPPQQGMVLIDSKRGKCHPKDLWCSERKERAA
jgi:hypothetical protein